MGVVPCDAQVCDRLLRKGDVPLHKPELRQRRTQLRCTVRTTLSRAVQCGPRSGPARSGGHGFGHDAPRSAVPCKRTLERLLPRDDPERHVGHPELDRLVRT
jgi:hypothetical protein